MDRTGRLRADAHRAVGFRDQRLQVAGEAADCRLLRCVRLHELRPEELRQSLLRCRVKRRPRRRERPAQRRRKVMQDHPVAALCQRPVAQGRQQVDLRRVVRLQIGRRVQQAVAADVGVRQRYKLTPR